MFNKDDTGSNVVPTGHNTSYLRENDATEAIYTETSVCCGQDVTTEFPNVSTGKQLDEA